MLLSKCIILTKVLSTVYLVFTCSIIGFFIYSLYLPFVDFNNLGIGSSSSIAAHSINNCNGLFDVTIYTNSNIRSISSWKRQCFDNNVTFIAVDDDACTSELCTCFQLSDARATFNSVRYNYEFFIFVFL